MIHSKKCILYHNLGHTALYIYITLTNISQNNTYNMQHTLTILIILLKADHNSVN